METNDIKFALVSDLLGQIYETEELIKIYKVQNGLSVQITQYEAIRESLVNELSNIMQEFHFKIEYQKEAA
jgi:hypothetical protein